MKEIKEINLFSKKFFLNFDNGLVSSNINDVSYFFSENKFIYNFPLYSTVYFCLEITDYCNLNCVYCFNKDKNNYLSKFDKKMEDLLDFLFNRYCACEKFFIDISGDGEPLGNFSFFEKLIDYIEKKQEEIRKEINLVFVTNGVLLDLNKINFLQNKGIIFGISIDGNKAAHDLYRKTINGESSYDLIMNNIRLIKNKEFLGCAITLSDYVFDLTKAIKEYLNLFGTISIKFARLDKPLTKDCVFGWISEYDKLTQYLFEEIKSDNLRPLFALLNGDDYFGKFIVQTFCQIHPLNRCDYGNGRIFIDKNFDIYPCPAIKKFKEYKLNEIYEGKITKIEKIFDASIKHESCNDCNFINLCGGECEVEKLNNGNHLNSSMCIIKKHLIILSKYLFVAVKDNCAKAFKKIVDFSFDKLTREKPDYLYNFLVNKYKDKSFKEVKEIYYSMVKKDKNQQILMEDQNYEKE